MYLRSDNLKIYLKKVLKLFFIFSLAFPLCDFLNAEDLSDNRFDQTSNPKKSESLIPQVSYLKDKEYEDYILSSGDYLEIQISDFIPELKGQHLIDGSGTVYLPFINRVYIKGLTINELTKILNQKYQDYVKLPQTRIKVIGYRPVRFITEGEIENPGLHTLAGSYFDKSTIESINNKSQNQSSISTLNSQNLDFISNKDKSNFTIDKRLEENNYGANSAYFPTIFDAIQKSGGINPYTDLSEIKVIRKDSISNGGGLKSTRINLLDVLFNNDMEQNIRILDGDRIILKKNKNKLDEQMSAAFRSNLNPKYLSIFVTGSVRQPGQKIITRSTTLNDAIALSGGRQPLSGNMILIRYKDNGLTSRTTYSYSRNARKGSKKNPFLKGGDILIVNESKINVASQVITKATDPFLGIYSLYKIFD